MNKTELQITVSIYSHDKHRMRWGDPLWAKGWTESESMRMRACRRREIHTNNSRQLLPLPLATLTPVFRLPMQVFGVNAHLAFGHGSLLSLDGFWCDGDDVLSLIVINESQMLQCGNDILFLDAGHLRDLIDVNGRLFTCLSWLQVNENVQQSLWPVAAVGEQPQIWQGLLRCARFALNLGQLVACNGTGWSKQMIK